MGKQLGFPFRGPRDVDPPAPRDPLERRAFFRRPAGPRPPMFPSAVAGSSTSNEVVDDAEQLELGDEPKPPSPPASGARLRDRFRRPREVRAATISTRRMSRRELEIGRLENPELAPGEAPPRPRTRGECAGVPRPCPFVSCPHHLFLDVSARTGSVKLNFPDLEPDELGESCVLDVADRGGITLEEIGAMMNLTRERVRQIEVSALAKLHATADILTLREIVDESTPASRRRLPVVQERPRHREELEPDFDVEQFASDAFDED